MSNVSLNIYKLFLQLVSKKYNGDLKCQHLSLVMCKGKVISPIGYNYGRVYIFGEKRGTFHAEMSNMNYLVNNLYCSVYGGEINKNILHEYPYV